MGPRATTLDLPLTERHREVLKAAAEGLTTKEIGDRMYLSESTVKAFLAEARCRLQARNTTHAVALFLLAG